MLYAHIYNGKVHNIVDQNFVDNNPHCEFKEIKSFKDKEFKKGDIVFDIEYQDSLCEIDETGEISTNLNVLKLKKIKQLKENSSNKIFAKYPIWKQVNFNTSVYEDDPDKDMKKNTMKQYIKDVINLVDTKEAEINSELKESTLKSVDISLSEIGD